MRNVKLGLLLKSTGLLVLALAFIFAFQYKSQAFFEDQVLARVDLEGRHLSHFSLPVYAHPQDGSGADYVLVIASPEDLNNLGYPYDIMDEYQSGSIYYLALERAPDAIQNIPATVQQKYWDGKQVVILNPTKAQNGYGQLRW